MTTTHKKQSRFVSDYRFAQKCGLANAIYGKPIDHDSYNGKKLDAAIEEARREGWLK